MKKVFKYLGLGILILAAGFLLINCQSVIYGARQLKGQLNIITNTVPIEEVLNDKNFPDSLKAQIKLIQEIKQFSVDSLGLKPSKNYSTFYDQQGKPILWVITACPPYELKAKTWEFPIAGRFSYKGHFEKKIADEEIEELKKQGYDTRLGEVSAWSTLGYLKDPILSSMLQRSEGALAALIIHELTHGTIFVKNNLDFNENLADFVGDEGAILFLKAKYGENSEQLKKYQFSKKYNDAYSRHLLRGVKKLDSLYKDFANREAVSDSIKKFQKQQLISEIMNKADTILADRITKNGLIYKKKSWNNNNLPNNAYFIGYLTYQAKQSGFEGEFTVKFDRNLKKYLAYLKQKYSRQNL